jgi:hypothetical protein
MTRISKKVAAWVDSQKEIAEEIGVSVPSVHSMLTGKIKLPIGRFLQIIHFLNPPQEEVTEVFNLYLEDLGLPENCITIKHSNTAETGSNNLSISSNSKIPRIIDAVMDSDIPDDVKVKVYKIIKSIK